MGGYSSLIPGRHKSQPLWALCGCLGTPRSPNLPLLKAEDRWPWDLSQHCPEMPREEGASTAQGRTDTFLREGEGC